jgi:hypothetical protein
MKKVFYLLAILILLFSSNSFATTDAKPASKEKLEVHKTVLQLDCIAVVVLSNKNLVNLSMENKYSFNVSKDTPFMYTEAGPIDLDVLKLIKPRKRDTHIFTTKESKNSINWIEDHYKNHAALSTEFVSKFISELADKKQALIVSRIKEFIPDFNINTELQRDKPRFYSQINGNETHYFLKGEATDTRLITFINKQNPLEFSENRLSISVSESYY